MMNKHKLKKQLRTLSQLLYDQYFNDWSKVERWLVTPNPQLGYVTPYSMVVTGRYNKLIWFIKVNLKGNRP